MSVEAEGCCMTILQWKLQYFACGYELLPQMMILIDSVIILCKALNDEKLSQCVWCWLLSWESMWLFAWQHSQKYVDFSYPNEVKFNETVGKSVDVVGRQWTRNHWNISMNTSVSCTTSAECLRWSWLSMSDRKQLMKFQLQWKLGMNLVCTICAGTELI